jgi:ribonuclease T2
MRSCPIHRGSFSSLLAVALIAAGLLLPTPASAQRGFSTGPGPSPYGGPPSGRHAPGRFDYYTLALSWSPTYCATARRSDSDLQCAPRRRPRPYAFVLHGLWPQFERGGAPDSCPYSGRVPQRTIDAMLDIMPAPGLVIHEYRKHGSCSGLDPDAFYRLARQLHDKVVIPASFQNLERARFVSPAELVREFVAANPGMQPDMIAVACGSPGDRLREVRICFDRNGHFTRCGENENQRRLCRSQRMYVPPVRGGADGAAPSPERGGREILPVPR